MDQHLFPLKREHHFFIAASKFLFHHTENSIVLAQDPIKLKDAKKYGLTPLILYGVAVSGLPIRWVTFTSIEQPRGIKDVLQEAWINGEGLRGRPDILRINRHLALASPDLMQDMARIGVRLEVADAKEKSLPASLRSAQDSSRWLLMRYGKKNGTLTEALETLCLCAQYDHSCDINQLNATSREVKEKADLWFSLPVQESTPVLAKDLDWTPGSWMSSWETSLPPDPPRYFNLDFEYGGAWLMTGEKTPDINDEEDYYLADSYYDNAADIAKNLVACWPNALIDISKCLDITSRELQWFLAGKAPLDQQSRFNLERLLGIQYDERMREYVGVGPYTLIAQKPKAIGESYITISHGGNARPCEIVPSSGVADPSWRYVLINTYGEPPTIVMVPRGDKIMEQLPSLLFNYSGVAPVSLEFYRDVVSTCARASREPTANIREMVAFAKRYEANWLNSTWEPN